MADKKYYLITYVYEDKGQFKFDDDVRCSGEGPGKSLILWLIRQRDICKDKAFILFEKEISKKDFDKFENFKINEKH